MITEKLTVYRCEHCRKFKRFRAAATTFHETHCSRNPARTPYIGELTFRAQSGVFGLNPTRPLPGFEDAPNWIPHTNMPQWWPGASGMIYAADGWHPVEGYSTGHGDTETWPKTNAGVPLNDVRPFWRRVYWLGLELDEKHESWVNDEDSRLNREPPILGGPGYY